MYLSCSLYKTWRIDNSKRIFDMSLHNTEAMDILIRNDIILSQYICPISLTPSMFPVCIRDDKFVWYFDKELLLDWYDRCAMNNRRFTNPLTMKPITIQSRDDIIVDFETQKIIIERIEFLENTLSENHINV